ncbi:unnamed protein product [Acanthoscelides obtectus]|uniref:DUF4371 domain-containing protein n=1 Tax=Acanthoscelides obtectus TaxID=200917 RepID=A0A9P0K3H7_ACAOB|nr:unnamed protein product [Acanthoscelides obtectus]CAK1652308.1 Protein ZBED8 [Acanthoscelides obtectus]
MAGEQRRRPFSFEEYADILLYYGDARGNAEEARHKNPAYVRVVVEKKKYGLLECTFRCKTFDDYTYTQKDEDDSIANYRQIALFSNISDPLENTMYHGLYDFAEKSHILNKRPRLYRMFASTSQRNDDALRASYNISLLIAKSGKPHTIGEKLILPTVEKVLKTVLHKPASDIIKRISLSNNTVERHIDEMRSDIESFLCNYLQTTHFSIQLDESTLPDNAALLLAYVRFIMNQEIYEELLFARTLITDTKGGSIFHVLKDYFIEKAIPLSNIISVATDGAPAMILDNWIVNPYGDIEETNVIIQEKLIELSTNEELKVQFKNRYQQFWLQKNVIPSGKGAQRYYQSPNEKKKQTGHH